MRNGGIFINYRRCDGSGSPRDHALFVEVLSQELAGHFGDGNVFIDTSADPTDGYPEKLPAELVECDVLLVVIHPEWLDDLREANGTPAGREFDRVHHEIRSALNGNLHDGGRTERRPEVIPILLEKSDPPKLSELPEDIRELAVLQAFRLRFGSLTNDLTRLVTELEIHTTPHWPPSPTYDPTTWKSQHGTTVRNLPGRLTSRGLAAAALAVGTTFSAWLAIKSWEDSLFFRSLFVLSTIIIVTILLTTVGVTVFGRSLYQLESRLHSQSAKWLLTARLGLFTIACVLFQSPMIKFQENYSNAYLIIIILGFFSMSRVFSVAITEIQKDGEWPPRISTKPRELRRAIARLEHRLTSSWKSPLSRIQREQAGRIINQLDSVLETLRNTVCLTRTRRDWLRNCCSKLAIGYAVWLAAMLGLAVAAMHEALNDVTVHDNVDVYLVILFGLLACAGAIGTIELLFRHDRRAQRWFIEEIEKDRESRLLRHMPAYREGWP